jgi:pimeloyl-ACP methyl ester carboxylesterase
MTPPSARTRPRPPTRRSRPDVVIDVDMPEVPPASPADDYPADMRAPGALLLALEGRAPWEFAASVAAAPWLRRLPRGDGHRVLVLPGLAANDLTTLPMRTFLKDRGYLPVGWKLGLNLGPRTGVLDALRERVRALHAIDGRPVSLLGWSLGGVYAREIAKEMPDLVRCVITLGSPFSGPPQATNAWWLFERVSGHPQPDAQALAALRLAPPVPTTSIYSRTDGIVAWQCSLNPKGPLAENIEVHASHIGLGLNPLAMMAIADRLAQDPAHWRSFDTGGLRGLFFKTGH